MIKVKVKGMHCQSCEVILKEDLAEIKGVSGVGADFRKGEVWFEGEKSVLPEVRKAIESDGYKVE